jgi:hypothetical protein
LVILRPSSWGWHFLPTRRLTVTRLHSIMSQKIEIFITAAVRTYKPKNWIYLCVRKRRHVLRNIQIGRAAHFCYFWRKESSHCSSIIWLLGPKLHSHYKKVDSLISNFNKTFWVPLDVRCTVQSCKSCKEHRWTIEWHEIETYSTNKMNFKRYPGGVPFSFCKPSRLLVCYSFRPWRVNWMQS